MADSSSTPSSSSSVDLESNLLVNKGLTVVDDPELGRTAVASRPLTVLYDIVIRERPLLAWKVGDVEDFLRKFQAASSETQSVIRDMFHPPLEEGSKLKTMATTLASQTDTTLPEDQIHQLLSICATNAHEFVSGCSQQRRQHSALFAYASKIAHSCLPNLAYTSVHEEGKGALEYKLIRPMPTAGSPAAFSYIGGGKKLFQTPTHQRRQKLMQTKAFFCRCPRCLAPDNTRSIRCTNCDEDRFVPCRYNDEAANEENQFNIPTWKCTKCEIEYDRDETQEKETQIEQRLEALVGSKDQAVVESLQQLVEQSTKILSPVHYLTVQALEALTEKSAQTAKSGDATNKAQLYLTAVEAGIRVVLANECLASGCPGCSSSAFAHDPIYEMGVAVFQTSKYLMQVPQSRRPAKGMALVQRYLPVMAQLAHALK